MVEAQSVGEHAATRDREGWVTGTLVLFCLASAVITVVAGLVQVTFGEYSMTFVEAWSAVFEPTVLFNLEAWSSFLFGTELPEMSTDSVVVWNLRLPRVFVAIIAGATLAISGAIFQAVTRNELASPFVLGVSSGAGFAVLATLVVFTGLAPYLPLIAALGGTVAFLIVYGIAWKGGTSPVRLVLAGVIVNMVFQSLQQGLFFFVDDLGVAQTAIAWLTGSFTGTGWGEVRIALIPGIAAIAIALASSRQLNVLLLGETTAKSLGMRVERVRFFLSGVAILAASVAIAVAGIVSFFGLVVPHIVRNVVGGDYRQLMVGCLFAGPALMVTADVGARLALGGMQMPVGVVTGLVGGPYFLYLMRKQQSMGEL
ncbi:iron ABC transporter permease [Haloterrigena sp. SYSU A558-1]|uniref:Cobalamin import system permease protein BtuC n=1 Tax=Haloterrigena gelatinilytica TaxID=2741724 RepID=A0A8J8GI53_9EURY|nr:iron ABC transporter permease [Haloterrigena gelatinilytica]NUB90428.1 iron ABC transporter permease [Haloterrigena gelatinilytica]NUC73754.1 iron ABC transporter permease [Haloterrigena gelatinilytica]